MISLKFYAITSAIFMGGLTLNSCVTDLVRLPTERVSNENHARNMKDFEGYYPNGLYKLDFEIGDHFKLKKPMFLHYSITGVVYLSPAKEFDTPPLREYLADPDQFKFGGHNNYQIIRLVPRGEVIHLVAIKHSSQAGYLPYFVFEGQGNWFRSSTFAVSRGKGDHSETYNREYFTKLAAQ